MKKSTSKGKSAAKKLRRKILPKPKKAEPELDGLEEGEQPLLYYGPPPAIKQIYKSSIYDKDFHPNDLLLHLRKGSTRSEICAAWGIGYGTLNEWFEVYPELSQALVIGVPAYDAYYKKALRDSAFGVARTVRENSLFFYLKNVAGFDEGGQGHEFNEGSNSTLEFVDDDE